MSELPLDDQAKSSSRSFGPMAIVILAVVFTPAAVAWIFSLLHP